MNLVRIAALALLAGFVAAGFAWYGIGLVQNLLVILRRRAEAAAAQRAKEAPESEEAKEDVPV